jgi:uncharacterized repeat protein (TIGR03803 family)
MLVRRRITRLAASAAVCCLASAGWDGAAADPPLTTLHAFTGGSDSSHPYGKLIFDTAGALYSTTNGGTASSEPNCNGDCGTVYRLTPPSTPSGSWTKSVLDTFTGSPDGAWPFAGLIFDSAGALYGTTFHAGAYSAGAVFKLTPPKCF